MKTKMLLTIAVICILSTISGSALAESENSGFQPVALGLTTAGSTPEAAAENSNTTSLTAKAVGLAKPDQIIAGKPRPPKPASGGTPPADPAVILEGGDTFASATVIPSLPYNDYGNTNGYLDNYSALCIPPGAPDVVYSFTPAADAVIDISLCGSSYDTGLLIYDAGYVAIDCNDDFCGYQSKIVNFAVMTGATYYIVVDGEGTENFGAYLISVTEALDTPPNDNCADVTPVPLTAGSTLTFTGDNTGATQDCPEPNGSMPEVWHAITTTECMDISIDFCGTPAVFWYVYIIMNTGCPCNGRVFADYWTDTECPDYNQTVHFYNVPAGTYYIPVLYAPEYGTAGPYTMNVNGVPCTPPVNDNCADVVPVPLDEGDTVTFTGNNTHATNDCPLLEGAPEVWHAITTTECLDLTLEYCLTDPMFGNVFVTLATGCPCGELIITGDYTQEECGNGNYKVRFYTLPAGTYYIPVLCDPFSQAAGPYTLQVTGVECPPPPVNDNCTSITPVPLSIGTPQVFTGTTVGATIDCPNNNVPFSPYPEVWHAITIDACMNLKIDYCGTDPVFGNFFITMIEGCPCAGLERAIYYTGSECTDGNYSIFFNRVEPGTYYIPILKDASAQANGPYTITVSGTACPAPLPNERCQDIVPADLFAYDTVTFLGSNEWATNDCDQLPGSAEVWEAFTTYDPMDLTIEYCGTSPVFSGIFYFLLDECPCGTNQIYYTSNNTYACWDGNYTLHFANLPAGTYYYPIYSNPYSQGNYSLSVFGSLVAPPSTNDDCVDVIDIGNVTDLPFNTQFASTDGPNGCDLGPNLWFRYTATATGIATASICHSWYDTKMAVYDGGSCDPLGTRLGCNDNYCNLQSRIDFRCIQGNQYMIEVGGFAGSNGLGFITTRVGPDIPSPVCGSNSLYGQTPTDPLAFWNFDYSDIAAVNPRRLFDNFQGVTGNICGLRFWGMDLFQSNMIEEMRRGEHAVRGQLLSR